MITAAEAVLRSLAWYMVMDYPPTAEELWWYTRAKRDECAMAELTNTSVCVTEAGRYFLPGYDHLLLEHERRNRFFARKWRRAQRLAALLRWVPSVRWLALCNTMAIGNARDEADIDVCIVVHRGTLWMTRLLLAGIAALFGRRPGERSGERDAWCFSFLLDDADLLLQRFALAPRDPYLEWWTIRLVPLLDDGIGEHIWAQQQEFLRDYPNAVAWIPWRRKRAYREGAFSALAVIDRWIGRLQRKFGSRQLQTHASAGGTSVVMSDSVLKTHIDDRRELFRTQYEELCRSLGIAPYLDAR